MSKSQDTRSFVLRVDAATMEALEAWADDEFRSINGQLQWILADALRRSGRLPGRRRARSGRGVAPEEVAPEEVAPVEAAPEGAAPERKEPEQTVPRRRGLRRLRPHWRNPRRPGQARKTPCRREPVRLRTRQKARQKTRPKEAIDEES